MTHPLNLELPADVFAPLSEAANRAGTTPESLAVAWLAAAGQRAAAPDRPASLEQPTSETLQVVDPFEKWIGAFSSDDPGWSAEHDRHIGEAAMDTHDSDR